MDVNERIINEVITAAQAGFDLGLEPPTPRVIIEGRCYNHDRDFIRLKMYFPHEITGMGSAQLASVHLVNARAVMLTDAYEQGRYFAGCLNRLYVEREVASAAQASQTHNIPRLWREVSALCAANAVHRKGFRLNDVTRGGMLKHLAEEVIELTLVNDIEEAGDILAILFHLMQRSGWSLDTVGEVARRKLRARFTEFNWTPYN